MIPALAFSILKERSSMALRLATLIAATSVAVAACGGATGADSATTTASVPVQSGNPLTGAEAYPGTCAACHGRDLEGVDGLGGPLVPNEFVAATSEEDLAAFLVVGRPASHPDNVQGIDMPPKGGNPSLSEQRLRDIAAYLKAQQ